MNIRPHEIRRQYRSSVNTGFVLSILAWLLIVTAVFCFFYKAYSFALFAACLSILIFALARKFLDRAKAIRKPFIKSYMK